MENRRKSVGLIIAKKNSSRLAQKNFINFCGKPMFVWNLEKLLKIFDKVYVSSDCETILKEAGKRGAITIERPADLCGDTPNIPVYQHALKFMENPEIIVAVQANSPTIRESLIKEAKELMEKNNCQELITCHPDSKIYGSIWAMTKDRLEKYGDPFAPEPDVLLADDSIDIHTEEDLRRAVQSI